VRSAELAAPRDPGRTRARRREARRRQRLARFDLALGVVAAIFLLLATPGLAVSALIALLVLGLCGASIVVERRRRVRRERGARPSDARQDAAPSPHRNGARVTRDRRRPPR
jgi:hypothetical protein